MPIEPVNSNWFTWAHFSSFHRRELDKLREKISDSIVRREAHKRQDTDRTIHTMTGWACASECTHGVGQTRNASADKEASDRSLWDRGQRVQEHAGTVPCACACRSWAQTWWRSARENQMKAQVDNGERWKLWALFTARECHVTQQAQLSTRLCFRRKGLAAGWRGERQKGNYWSDQKLNELLD